MTLARGAGGIRRAGAGSKSGKGNILHKRVMSGIIFGSGRPSHRNSERAIQPTTELKEPQMFTEYDNHFEFDHNDTT